MKPSREQWIIPFAIQLIPSGLLFVGSLWIRESPRWLFLHGRPKKAMENLCWIRQLDASEMYIIEEVAAIDNAVESQKTTVGVGLWQPFKAVAQRPTMQWRLFLGCMLFFWQNGSGINAINYYSPTIFLVSLMAISLSPSLSLMSDLPLFRLGTILTSTAEPRHRVQHGEPDDGNIRCHQGHHDIHMAVVPGRSARKEETPAHRCHHRIDLHVGHRILHLRCEAHGEPQRPPHRWRHHGGCLFLPLDSPLHSHLERHTMGDQLGKCTLPSHVRRCSIRLTRHDQEFFDPNFRSLAQACEYNPSPATVACPSSHSSMPSSSSPRPVVSHWRRWSACSRSNRSGRRTRRLRRSWRGRSSGSPLTSRTGLFTRRTVVEDPSRRMAALEREGFRREQVLYGYRR